MSPLRPRKYVHSRPITTSGIMALLCFLNMATQLWSGNMLFKNFPTTGCQSPSRFSGRSLVRGGPWLHTNTCNTRKSSAATRPAPSYNHGQAAMKHLRLRTAVYSVCRGPVRLEVIQIVILTSNTANAGRSGGRACPKSRDEERGGRVFVTVIGRARNLI
jgi:hypothetical protein